jgi:hypothetical protein
MIARPLAGRRGTSAACDPAALHVLAYAAGFTFWHYRTEAALDEVARPGYFDAAGGLLRPGDRIAVSVHRAGELAAAGDFCVTAGPRPEVRVAPLAAMV